LDANAAVREKLKAENRKLKPESGKNWRLFDERVCKMPVFRSRRRKSADGP
jgi:hypothetical protein